MMSKSAKFWTGSAMFVPGLVWVRLRVRVRVRVRIEAELDWLPYSQG